MYDDEEGRELEKGRAREQRTGHAPFLPSSIDRGWENSFVSPLTTNPLAHFHKPDTAPVLEPFNLYIIQKGGKNESLTRECHNRNLYHYYSFNLS